MPEPEFHPGCVDSSNGHWVQDAPSEAVDYILSQPTETDQQHDGRSRWVWIRLPNGDLALACYPQGDTYFHTEHWRSI